MEGEQIREELILDKVRLLAATMYNASGHAKRTVKPTDIMKLKIDDKKPKVRVPTHQELKAGWQQKQHGLK